MIRERREQIQIMRPIVDRSGYELMALSIKNAALDIGIISRAYATALLETLSYMRATDYPKAYPKTYTLEN